MPKRVMFWNVQGLSAAAGADAALKRRIVYDVVAAAAPDVLFVCELGHVGQDRVLAMLAHAMGVGAPVRGTHYAALPSADGKDYGIILNRAMVLQHVHLNFFVSSAPLGIATDGPRQVVALNPHIAGHWCWFVHSVSTTVRARRLMQGLGALSWRAAALGTHTPTGRIRMARVTAAPVLGTSEPVGRVTARPEPLAEYAAWKEAYNAWERGGRLGPQPPRPAVPALPDLYRGHDAVGATRQLFAMRSSVLVFGDFNLDITAAGAALEAGARAEGWDGISTPPVRVLRPVSGPATQQSGHLIDYCVNIGRRGIVRAVDLRPAIDGVVRQAGLAELDAVRDELATPPAPPREGLRPSTAAASAAASAAERSALVRARWRGAIAAATPAAYRGRADTASGNPALRRGPDHFPVAYDIG